jgi:hypothetical protein
MLEREIEPYLYSIKNELRLFADNFHKEVGDHKLIINEINNFKQMVTDNKKLITTFHEDFEKKLYEMNDNNLNYHNKLESSKSLIEVNKTY